MSCVDDGEGGGESKSCPSGRWDTGNVSCGDDDDDGEGTSKGCPSGCCDTGSVSCVDDVSGACFSVGVGLT